MPISISHWIIVLGSSCMAVVVIVATQTVHGLDRLNWHRHYENVQVINECEWMILENQSFLTSKAPGTSRWQGIQLPLRGNKDAPRVYPPDVQHLRCSVDLQGFSDQDSAWMSIGPVFGRSEIYLDETLKASVKGQAEIEFPLLPSELGKNSVLTIISEGTSVGAVGPASLIPMFVTDDARHLLRINRYRHSILTDQPSFLMGVAVSVTILFLLLWGFGLRYKDIALVLLFSASVAMINLSGYLQVFFDDLSLLRRLRGVLYLVNALIPSLFLLHYANREHLWNKFFFNGTFIVVALGAAFIGLVKESSFYDLKLLGVTQSYLAVICIVATIITLSIRSSKDPRQRRRKILALLVGSLIATALTIQLIFQTIKGIYIEPFTQLGLLVFIGGLVCRDLVFRQHEYFVERQRRSDSEKKALRAEAFSQTAQMIIHDVRRPFNLMRMVSKNLGLENATIVQLIQAQNHAESLLHDLINLSVERSWDALPIDCTHVIRTALASLVVDGGKSIIVKCEVRSRHVLGSESHLVRVLQNLLENAVQSMPKEGIIHITVDHGTFEVQNSGTFIPEKKIEKLFELGYTDGRPTGTGIGLAFVRRCLEQHGASIRCQSSSAGGTSFHFTLPVVPNSAISSEKWSVQLELRRKIELQTPDPAGVPILAVIDDDDLVALGWSMHCSDYLVEVYSSPEELLNLVSSDQEYLDRFCAIVVDYQYKNSTLTGVDLARKLQGLPGTPPRMFLSTSMPRQEALAEKGLFEAVIKKKPYKLKELLGNVG